MTSHHKRLARAGLVLTTLGFILASLGVLFHSTEASAYEFEGKCLDLNNAGVCVLDEPEGRNPAVHGMVAYLRTTTTMTFTLDATDRISEVQICMQTSGPFAEGANVCAGSHGRHVAFSHIGNVYLVDLVAERLAAADPLYWTLHVVAGGRTLQVIGEARTVPTTTTTTTGAGTTTSTAPPASTTSSPATTTVGQSTTTSAAQSTTSTTSVGTSTTSASPTTTSVASTSVLATTSTTFGVQVLPETLSRTGGPHWWALLLGAAMMLVGVTLLAATRLLALREI